MLVDGLAPQSKGGWGGGWGGVGGGVGWWLSGVQGVLLKSRTYILCRSVLKGLIPAIHNLTKYLKNKALHKYGSIRVYLKHLDLTGVVIMRVALGWGYTHQRHTGDVRTTGHWAVGSGVAEQSVSAAQISQP